MAEPIVSGNAFEDGRPFGQWFIGDLQAWVEGKGLPFDPETASLRHTRAVEIKLGKHSAGEQRPGGWTLPSERVTLSLLVRGEFLLRFRPAGQPGPERSYHLHNEGDYLVWQETLSHTWTALQDSVILTVRWQENA